MEIEILEEQPMNSLTRILKFSTHLILKEHKWYLYKIFRVHSLIEENRKTPLGLSLIFWPENEFSRGNFSGRWWTGWKSCDISTKWGSAPFRSTNLGLLEEVFLRLPKNDLLGCSIWAQMNSSCGYIINQFFMQFNLKI